MLVFVEVKARSSSFMTPREAVGSVKQQRIKTAALTYLCKTEQTESYCRFDVIEIMIHGGAIDIQHIENAFE